MPKLKGTLDIGKLSGRTIERDLRIHEIVTRTDTTPAEVAETEGVSLGTVTNACKRVEAIMAIGRAFMVDGASVESLCGSHGITFRQLTDIGTLYKRKHG